MAYGKSLELRVLPDPQPRVVKLALPAVTGADGKKRVGLNRKQRRLADHRYEKLAQQRAAVRAELEQMRRAAAQTAKETSDDSDRSR